jgi:hypothetical protein
MVRKCAFDMKILIFYPAALAQRHRAASLVARHFRLAVGQKEAQPTDRSRWLRARNRRGERTAQGCNETSPVHSSPW